jgi:hypothetical protein
MAPVPPDPSTKRAEYVPIEVMVMLRYSTMVPS